MNSALSISKYSIGVGDRFAHQAKAQLRACMMAAQYGVDVIPVWNKSNREHTIIGSDPASTRAEADQAVRTFGWNKPYYVDADHINLKTVERFIGPCDFFTIDVADWIGQPADPMAIETFIGRHSELVGDLHVPRIERPLRIRREFVHQIAGKYFPAVQEAARIY